MNSLGCAFDGNHQYFYSLDILWQTNMACVNNAICDAEKGRLVETMVIFLKRLTVFITLIFKSRSPPKKFYNINHWTVFLYFKAVKSGTRKKNVSNRNF